MEKAMMMLEVWRLADRDRFMQCQRIIDQRLQSTPKIVNQKRPRLSMRPFPTILLIMMGTRGWSAEPSQRNNNTVLLDLT
jgi:hypothetical protein